MGNTMSQKKGNSHKQEDRARQTDPNGQSMNALTINAEHKIWSDVDQMKQLFLQGQTHEIKLRQGTKQSKTNSQQQRNHLEEGREREYNGANTNMIHKQQPMLTQQKISSNQIGSEGRENSKFLQVEEYNVNSIDISSSIVVQPNKKKTINQLHESHSQQISSENNQNSYSHATPQLKPASDNFSSLSHLDEYMDHSESEQSEFTQQLLQTSFKEKKISAKKECQITIIQSEKSTLSEATEIFKQKIQSEYSQNYQITSSISNHPQYQEQTFDTTFSRVQSNQTSVKRAGSGCHDLEDKVEEEEGQKNCMQNLRQIKVEEVEATDKILEGYVKSNNKERGNHQEEKQDEWSILDQNEQFQLLLEEAESPRQ